MQKSNFDRVRDHTADDINQALDAEAAARVAQYAGAGTAAITRRIEELDREWDTERILEMNASALAFLGVARAVSSDRKWLIVPSIVLPFLFLHATQGWCPPLPILRRLGVRTRREIDCEKYALKAMRGDFEGLDGSGQAAFDAARK